MTIEQYEKLNDYLNGIFIALQREDKIFINNLMNFCYLSYKIINSFSTSIEKKINSNSLTFEDVFLLAREIIESINKNYLPLYDEMVQNGVINFNYDENKNGGSFRNLNGQPFIEIDRKFNYDDVIILVHEFFHYTNGKGKKQTINRVFLTEALSIYFEQYAIRYLSKEKNVTTEEINSNDRIINFLRTNDIFTTYCYIFLAFENLGNIGPNTKEDMSRTLQIENNIFEEECLKFLKEMENIDGYTFSTHNLYEQNIRFFKSYQYIIGTLLAFYALEECKLEDMIQLNDKINSEEYAHIDVFVLLKSVGITVNETFINKSIEYIKQAITATKVIR